MINQINQSSEDGHRHAVFSFIQLEWVRKTAQSLLSTHERQARTEPGSVMMTAEAINSEWRLALL